MAKVSLEDLRNGTPVARTERTYHLCVRRDLMAEVDDLLAEVAGKPVRRSEDEDGQPNRLNPTKRDAEIEARLADLEQQIDDATGSLRLRALTNGEWATWVNEHPARDGDERDEQLAFGICNTDDLANDLGKWALSWNGEELAPGDWDRHLFPNAAGGDLKALVNLVVMMQEAAEDPKWRLRGLRGAPSSSDSDPSPAQ